MTDTIFLVGNVAADPKPFVTNDGLVIAEFRIACTPRRLDAALDKWIDGDTTWYNVKTFRQLATNVLVSVKKGQRVAVRGGLKVRPWTSGTKNGTEVLVEADFVGHDLKMGTAKWTRSGGNPDSGPADSRGPSDIAGSEEADGFGASWAVVQPAVGEQSGPDAERADAGRADAEGSAADAEVPVPF